MTEQAPDDRLSLAANMRVLLGVMGRRRRLQLAVTFVLMVLGAVAELVTIGAVLPLLAIAADPDWASRIPALRGFLEAVGIGRGANMIVAAALLLIGAAVAAAVLRLMLNWVTQKLVFGLQHDVTMRVYGRVIRQRYEQFVRQNSSVVLAGMEKVYFVTIGVIFPIIAAATSAGIALCIIVFLFFIDPLTAAVASASMGLLYVAITLTTRRISMHVSRRSSVLRTERIKLIQESLGGLRDIILDHSEAVFERKLESYDNEMRRLQIIAAFISNAPRFIVEGCGIVLVALLSIYFSMKPGGVVAALPVLGALALGAQRLLPLLQQIYVGWANYSIHSHNMRDVVALLNAPVGRARGEARRGAIEPLRHTIALRHLSYSYGGGTLALEDIDLTIAKGERVGLIGKTGSGKSTLVDVLMGLLPPTRGEMLVDGVTVDESSIGNWQVQIAHVPQAIFLADDTIAANIAFGSAEELDLDRVREAAGRADILGFIDQLPQGIMTRVGERGVRLSGGQRQRIGIARALYKKATVLILDEATSALDDRTEAAVMESVTGLGRELTIIMIAHRLSTVAACDTIYRLESGRIVQKGSYEDV
ncbi:MAG: ABC transporter ATP-binding protein, partial [Sphingomonadales bacterium]